MGQDTDRDALSDSRCNVRPPFRKDILESKLTVTLRIQPSQKFVNLQVEK